MCINWGIRRLLYDYCLGQLNEADEQRVEEHLLVCDACHCQVVERLHFTAWLRQNPATLEPAPSPEPAISAVSRLWTWHRGWAAAAAALLLLAVPTGLVVHYSSSQDARYALELPEVEALKSLDGDDRDFHYGISDFQQRKFKDALAHFTTYLKHSPGNFDANFFSGLCYLELSKQNVAGVIVKMDRDKARKGISMLERAKEIAASLQAKTGNPRYYADTTYYLGKAHYMLGDRSQAKEYFQLYLAVDEPLLAHREEVRDLLKSLP
jgi:tetratricopeptide (TPR) repeat protein